MSDKRTPEQQMPKIPDIEIVDLELADFEDENETIASQGQNHKGKSRGSSQDNTFSEPAKSGGNPVLKVLSHVNLHIVLASVALLVIAVIAYKVVNWGEYIDLDEIFKDGAGEYSDTFDSIIRLVDKSGMPIEPANDDGKTTIVLFGNAPFADDRNAKDSLASLIADMADATVYNCSVSGSYLASLPYENSYEKEAPVNAFNFYWMCHLASGSLVDQSYKAALQTLGSSAPPEAQEVYDTVKSIDFSQVDVIGDRKSVV